MKTPAELKAVLRRQWENPTLREARLLGTTDAWPIVIPLRRPSSHTLNFKLDAVKQHVAVWRNVRIGEVVWQDVPYRGTSAPVAIPTQWKLRKPSEWIEACADSSMRQEFEVLATLVEHTNSIFHALFIRRRSLWRGRPTVEVIQAARLAMSLDPGGAQGRPLRMLSLEGIDTKFFERHSRLLTTLLDVRFDGEVSRIGLENFLGALREGDHWLLVMDLDGSLLPFRKQRVRSSELQETALPGERLLIVENESCQHHLPVIPRTIAILGAGFDLGWTQGTWLQTKQTAYWGDIDTWGLQFLAKARTAIGRMYALMMTEDIYERFAGLAVPEPFVASTSIPSGLSQSEQLLYLRLLRETRGRLEQEFLPPALVCKSILDWADGSFPPKE